MDSPGRAWRAVCFGGPFYRMLRRSNGRGYAAGPADLSTPAPGFAPPARLIESSIRLPKPAMADVVTFPGSPFRLHRPFAARRGPARGHRGAGGGPERRARLPDAAGRHRLGQDLHDGQRHRPHRPAGAGDRAQQDAGGAALLRDARVLPGERRRVLRLLLRLLPARGLRPLARPLHREGQLDQRAHRAAAPVGHQERAGAPRHGDRGDGVVHLRHRRPGGLPGDAPHPARARSRLPARPPAPPGGDAVHAQRHRLPARHLPRARRHDRHLPRGAGRDGAARLALRRRDRVAHALRPAHRAPRAEASRASRCTRRATT